MLFRPTSREITTKFSSRRRRFGRSKRASHIILAASTSSRTHLDPREPPKVVIVGGGPGGLLAGIMLSNLGIRSTVLERSRERDGWSCAKSYTIVLNERGQDALKKAGCLEEALEAGMRRQYVYLVDGDTGEMKAVPKNPAGLGFTRPLLMDCLESIAGGLPNVTVKRGVGVSSVEKCATGSGLELRLEDDESLLTATHVIGCDGKWSKVRQSVASFRKQARLVTCPSFAVHMTSNFTPAGWERDGTYVIRPSEQQQQQHYYIIASPLPEKGMSMTMVCQSEMAEKYPWLEPPTSKKPRDVLR
jgi:2-polyprenyl-6-methoxyphenol hydroxylase-like FAD-dependent oxidoreductase